MFISTLRPNPSFAKIIPLFRGKKIPFHNFSKIKTNHNLQHIVIGGICSIVWGLNLLWLIARKPKGPKGKEMGKTHEWMTEGSLLSAQRDRQAGVNTRSAHGTELAISTSTRLDFEFLSVNAQNPSTPVPSNSIPKCKSLYYLDLILSTFEIFVSWDSDYYLCLSCAAVWTLPLMYVIASQLNNLSASRILYMIVYESKYNWVYNN